MKQSYTNCPKRFFVAFRGSFRFGATKAALCLRVEIAKKELHAGEQYTEKLFLKTVPAVSHALSPSFVVATNQLDRQRAIGIGGLRTGPTHRSTNPTFSFDLRPDLQLLSVHPFWQNE